MELTVQAKTGLLMAYHPSNTKKRLLITHKNESYIRELESQKLVTISGYSAFLTQKGMDYTTILIDTDPEARAFYYNINKR